MSENFFAEKEIILKNASFFEFFLFFYVPFFYRPFLFFLNSKSFFCIFNIFAIDCLVFLKKMSQNFKEKYFQEKVANSLQAEQILISEFSQKSKILNENVNFFSFLVFRFFFNIIF